jgi:signal transduction histidine kinase
MMQSLSRLSLLSKGLLLVGTLLVLELSFFAILTSLLEQAETDIWKEWHSKRIVTELDSIGRSLASAGYTIFMYKTTKSSSFKVQFEKNLQKVADEVHSLKLLYADTPERTVDMKLIDRELARIISILRESMVDADGRPTALRLMESTDMRDAIASQFTKVTAELGLMAEAEQGRLARAPADSANSRYKVQQWLVIGICLNVGIAVALAVLFIRGITHRLTIMTDNTKRLANKQPLNPPLAQSDEIALLDRTFHKMAHDLQAIDKLKSEFSAMITHDLRAPLASILTNLQLIEQDLPDDATAKTRQRLNRAENSCELLLKLIADLLQLDKLESGKLELEFDKVSAAQLVDQSIEAVQDLAEKNGIRLGKAIAEADFLGDRDRLVQVLINLLSNAIKFSPPDSQVAVSVEQDGAGWLVFKVSDRGRGIPASEQKKIFDRFQQVELDDAKLKGGSGLGLAICKAIITEHNGEIGVESQEGQGSTFWFRIPSLKVGLALPVPGAS